MANTIRQDGLASSTAIIITAAMSVVSLVSKRLTTRAITTGCLAVFAASLALLSAALNGYTIAAFYVWMELIGAIVIMQAWTLVGNAFDPRQAKRLFGVIATGGSIAATAGGAGVAFLASRFAPPVLIAVVAAVLGIACVTAWSASRFEAPRRKAPVSLPSGRAKLGRYTIAIATIVAASAVVSAIVQYRFQVGAAAAFPNRGELIVFFGRFYSWTGVASLITQLFLSRLLLSRFGVIAALAVLPVCFTGGSVFTLLSPSLWSVGFCRFSDLTFKYTLNNTSVEMLWLPVPPEERRAVKPWPVL